MARNGEGIKEFGLNWPTPRFATEAVALTVLTIVVMRINL
jgi:hypothetical protein